MCAMPCASFAVRDGCVHPSGFLAQDANKDEAGKEDSTKKKAAPSAEKKQAAGTRSRVRRVKGGGR